MNTDTIKDWLARKTELAGKATEGPWEACGSKRGGCQCCQVWSTASDHPVATAEHGEWGDSYPALRVVRDEGIGEKMTVEAYMEGMVYGEVPEQEGKFNAAFIADSRTTVPLALEIARIAVEALHRTKNGGVVIEQSHGSLAANTLSKIQTLIES